MLADLKMDSLLSIQDQYLSAMATLLTAGQQQKQQVVAASMKQQQQQQQQQRPSFDHEPPQVSTSANRRHGQQQQRRKSVARHQLGQQQVSTSLEPTGCGAPLDLTRTTSRAASLLGGLAGASNLLTFPHLQSANHLQQQQQQPQREQNSLPLDLATKHNNNQTSNHLHQFHDYELQQQHHQRQQRAARALLLAASTATPPATAATSSYSSLSSPISCSSSRPSSASSSNLHLAFQDNNNNNNNSQRSQQQRRQQSDRLISSSNGSTPRPQGAARTQTGSGSKKSSKGTKSHLCGQCGRSFSRSDMLTRHSRLHSGLKPYQCAKCLQVFSRSDHLSTHERTHTGEKPYQCHCCSYSACRRDMITRHMRTHTMGSVGQSEVFGESKSLASRRQNLKAGPAKDRLRNQSNQINEDDESQTTDMSSDRMGSGAQEHHDDVSTSLDFNLN